MSTEPRTNTEWYGRWLTPAVWPEKGEDEKKRSQRDRLITEQRVQLDKDLRKLSIQCSRHKQLKPVGDDPIRVANWTHRLVEILNDINNKTEKLANLALEKDAT
jgi:hypothetical protein